MRNATLAELDRTGFEGLTIDGVARAANVNRTTIYRRWPSKSALLAAVIEPFLLVYDQDPDTGSLRCDLLELMRTICDHASLPEGRAISQAVASNSAELKALVDATNERVLGAFRRCVDRARARGEQGPADPEMVTYLAFYGLSVWEPTHGTVPTAEHCRRILQVVLGAGERDAHGAFGLGSYEPAGASPETRNSSFPPG